MSPNDRLNVIAAEHGWQRGPDIDGHTMWSAEVPSVGKVAAFLMDPDLAHPKLVDLVIDRTRCYFEAACPRCHADLEISDGTPPDLRVLHEGYCAVSDDGLRKAAERVRKREQRKARRASR